MFNTMASFVVLIAISVFCCLDVTKAQTHPVAANVYLGEPWIEDLNFPVHVDICNGIVTERDDDELCAIWVNLTAKWHHSHNPQAKGTSTIDLRFKHPKFKEVSVDNVIEIQHDEEKSKKAIPICFAACQTTLQQMDQKTFTLKAKTKEENAIDLQVTSEKMSTPSYIEHCSDRNTLAEEKETLLDNIDTLAKEKETLFKEKETLVREKETLAKEKETLLDQINTLVDENKTLAEDKYTFRTILIVLVVLLVPCLFVGFVWNINKTPTGGNVLPGPAGPSPGTPGPVPGTPNSFTSTTTQDSLLKSGKREGHKRNIKKEE